MKRILQHCLLVACLVITTVAQAKTVSRNYQQIIESGELRVGVSIFAPWVMEGKDQTLIGSELDMSRRLATDMGLKLELSRHDWNQLIPQLMAGNIDVIVSGMGINPARALQVNFSKSYGESGIGLASNIKATQNITTMAGLQQSDNRMGAVAGTAAEDLTKRLFKKAKLRLFDSIKDAGEALKKSQIDILVGPSVEMKYLQLRNPDFIDQPLARPLLSIHEAFAIRKGDVDLLNFLDSWVISRTADSWITSTRYYWFNTLRWQEKIADE